MDASPYFSIIDYEVDGPDTQRELIDAFAAIQEQWVRGHAGYGGARLFASVDGRRVVNLIRFSSEAAFREFEETSDTPGRQAAVRAAVAGVSGWAESRMTGLPRYHLAREVLPT